MSTTNHTPTLTLDEGCVYLGQIVGGPDAVCVYESGHRIVGGLHTIEERRAFAASMVAKFNAHDELVAALRNAQRALNTVECSLSSMQLDVISDIARVLAKVQA